jgi:hypothetical protein
MPPTEKAWDDLLEEFRALGGRAENLRLGQGALGRGLFPIDCSQPVELHIPEKPLFPVDEVVFDQGVLRSGPNSLASPREKIWFEEFQRQFSWGAEGRREAETLIQGMQALPQELRQLLATRFDLTYCLEDYSDELVQKQFIDSRAIRYGERRVLMSLGEMANHGYGGAFQFGGGLTVKGRFEGEILVAYGDHDPWSILHGWGFACPEPTAFSLPLTVRASFGDLVVMRRLEQGKFVQIPSLGGVRLPELRLDREPATLSFVTLGMRATPGLPKGIFYRVFREAGATGAEETFDLIRCWNQHHFLRLIEALEGHQGPVVRTLREMARLQLQSMCYCYGALPL